MAALFTVEEAARELRIGKSTLHHLTSAKQFGHVRLGRRLYFSQEDLERYIASRRVEVIPAGGSKVKPLDHREVSGRQAKSRHEGKP